MRSYIPFLSLRYLRYHKLSSGLGILGVALGVGLVIVVVSVMDGFQTRIRRELLRNTAAVTVTVEYDLDASRLCEEIKRTVPGVVEAAPVLQTVTLVGRTYPGGRTRKFPCRVEGIDPGPANRLSPLADRLRTGETPESPLSLRAPATPEDPFLLPPSVASGERRVRKEKQGIIVGIGLLRALRARVGDQVTLYTIREADAGRDGAPPPDHVAVQQEKFRVTAFYNSGDGQVDETLVLMDRRDAASFFEGTVTAEASEIRLRLDDPDRADEVKGAIMTSAEALVLASRRSARAAEQPVYAETWRDQNRRFLMAVENERGLLLLISSFSFIVVAFLIGSTQSMLVVEKTREIGVLRSLGASVSGTAGVFLGNGFFIGTIGALGGWGIGATVATNAPSIIAAIKEVTGRDLFPAEIYRFGEVPIEVRGPFVLTVCLAAVGFAVLGSLLPALRAASLDPVASLHNE